MVTMKGVAIANLTECGEMMTEPLVGNCTGSKTPNDWYPETGSGQMSHRRLTELRSSVAYVIDLCNSCPVKDSCLEQGMRKENLPYGIWGGKLAGQRLAMAGYTKDDFLSVYSEEGRAFKLTELLGVQ
jgi:hypothetical protein